MFWDLLHSLAALKTYSKQWSTIKTPCILSWPDSLLLEAYNPDMCIWKSGFQTESTWIIVMIPGAGHCEPRHASGQPGLGLEDHNQPGHLPYSGWSVQALPWCFDWPWFCWDPHTQDHLRSALVTCAVKLECPSCLEPCSFLCFQLPLREVRMCLKWAISSAVPTWPSHLSSTNRWPLLETWTECSLWELVGIFGIQCRLIICICGCG